MPDAPTSKIQYIFGHDGLNYSAIMSDQASEVEISLEDFKAMSHFNGLRQIAQAIDGLANAVHALADAVQDGSSREE